MKKKKNNDRITRRERNEHLTNWYMINLCWGIVGLFVLILIYYGYNNVKTILTMQPMMWVLTGLFAAGTVAIWILGKTGVIKNKKRADHYTIFLAVCLLAALWLALYNRIRPIMESCARTILNRPNLTVSSYWNVWLLMIAIGIYLVVAFIYYVVKVTRK